MWPKTSALRAFSGRSNGTCGRDWVALILAQRSARNLGCRFRDIAPPRPDSNDVRTVAKGFGTHEPREERCVPSWGLVAPGTDRCLHASSEPGRSQYRYGSMSSSGKALKNSGGL